MTKVAKKTVTKKTAKVVKTTKKPQIAVKDVLKKINPKVTLTKDAVELLEAYLVDLFTTIASKADAIVKKAKGEKRSAADVRRAVNKVFN
ncbi:MAG: hypothetical protein ACKO96_42310 [Flammeovirgaceae bacterium]